jgi:hypothetical protein
LTGVSCFLYNLQQIICSNFIAARNEDVRGTDDENILTERTVFKNEVRLQYLPSEQTARISHYG